MTVRVSEAVDVAAPPLFAARRDEDTSVCTVRSWAWPFPPGVSLFATVRTGIERVLVEPFVLFVEHHNPFKGSMVKGGCHDDGGSMNREQEHQAQCVSSGATGTCFPFPTDLDEMCMPLSWPQQQIVLRSSGRPFGFIVEPVMGVEPTDSSLPWKPSSTRSPPAGCLDVPGVSLAPPSRTEP